MKLRSKLIITILLQSLGSITTVITTLIISHHYGPAGQGYMSYIRSSIDLLSTIALFGFPQAFIYMINRQIISLPWVMKFTWVYSLLLILVGSGITGILYNLGLLSHNGLDNLAIISIAIASVTLTIQVILRGITLTFNSAYIFNIATILPSILIALICLFWHPSKYQELVIVHPITATLSGIITYFFILPSLNSQQELPSNKVSQKQKIFTALEHGFWNFMPGVSAHLILSLSYDILRANGKNDALAGYFSISYLFLSLSVLPLNMIIPILTDTWLKTEKNDEVLVTYTRLSHLGTLVTILAIIASLILTEPITVLIFGDQYLPSVITTQIFAFGVYALYQNRLLSASLIYLGVPHIVAIGSVIRTIVILGMLVINKINLDVIFVAIAWNIGELASMIYMATNLAIKTHWSIWEIAGISKRKMKTYFPF